MTLPAVPEFKGLRVLLVEDDVLIAMEMEDWLNELGCEVIGPFGRLDEAMASARDAELDGAILDLNLRGESSSPLIEDLDNRGVPVVLCSGFLDLPTMKEQLQGIPLLTKPCNHDKLVATMRANFVPGCAQSCAAEN